MDIPSLSIALNQNKLMNQVSVAMLSKSLDLTETMADNITDMIDSTSGASLAEYGIGANIDISL
ncbi:MAG: YjfB family protein [Candidatus Galacturonibacter soehngenii]|nr:YjfB family protein [Candidatus Galacturonibacter soehngenii]